MTASPSTPSERPARHVDASELAHRITELFSAPTAAEALAVGLAEAADLLGADGAELYVRDEDVVRLVSTRLPWHSPAMDIQPRRFFPWGLDPVRVERFVYVENAGALPAYPGGMRLAAFGVTSCLHVPLTSPTHRPGAMHVAWTTPPIAPRGAQVDLVRMVGHALLEITHSIG